jgi:hypothetical protein
LELWRLNQWLLKQWLRCSHLFWPATFIYDFLPVVVKVQNMCKNAIMRMELAIIVSDSSELGWGP